MQLFGNIRRERQIEMEVVAAAVLRIGIDEIVRQTGNGREFYTRFLVVIRVTAAAIDRPVTESQRRQAVSVVCPNRNSGGSVDHKVVNTLVPFQRRVRIKVAEAENAVRSGAGEGAAFGSGQGNGHR